MERKKTRTINVGGVKIGGDSPISIQSMTNTDTRDVRATCKQINALQEAGCEIVRVAVPDMAAAAAIGEIKKQIQIPLVADVHFDYRLALQAMENGVDKLRINPGNIGGLDRIKAVVSMAKERGIAIRIGVNSGSLEGASPLSPDSSVVGISPRSLDDSHKHREATPEQLVQSALRHVKILEDMDFFDICLSVKSSNVPASIEAYVLLSKMVDYPLHVGITEAGTVWAGAIKSSLGIGAILSRGIGDTIRVSLTGDPVEEIHCAKEILKGLRLRRLGVELTSCPTCGRTEIDLISIANEVEKRCASINKSLHVAVMGCIVNGPGEAAAADIGIAGGKGRGVIFKKGKVVRTVVEAELVEALMGEIEGM
ncbi:MAG: flavodoxin-dependent (E)-4-hydroxy-3-methylbut-2-enyl-diphosphate synthase [Defluviitaleaceae bacterium]|nr:flavodoxin-dependent (E)-4-hydroxy-3-methylbut-2-enyl-diphosphate synthase [Defluviitaleaceae bacterium]